MKILGYSIINSQELLSLKIGNELLKDAKKGLCEKIEWQKKIIDTLGNELDTFRGNHRYSSNGLSTSMEDKIVYYCCNDKKTECIVKANLGKKKFGNKITSSKGKKLTNKQIQSTIRLVQNRLAVEELFQTPEKDLFKLTIEQIDQVNKKALTYKIIQLQ